MKDRILIAEDDPHISNVVKLYLDNNGFDVCTAIDGEEALEKFRQFHPHLIILDVQMPGKDGMEVCQEIRQRSNVPIIFLSCKAESADKILGLTVGGDDYITKPFDPGELLARVNARLRRHQQHNGSVDLTAKGTLAFPGLVINPSTHDVIVNDVDVKLSAKEFQLLLLLAQSPNIVMGMDEIYQSLWQADSYGDSRTVMVHISNLRKKIEPDHSNPEYIVTVKGVGYKFVPPNSSES